MHHRSSPIEPLETRLLLAANVTVNALLPHQTISGLGGDAARVVWANDTNATDPVGDLMVNQLNPKIVRFGIPWQQWEPVNDNADPNVADPNGFIDAGKVHNEFLYLQQLQAKGITLIGTAWNAPSWMTVPVTTPLGGQAAQIPDTMFAEAAESLTQYLVKARDTYGVNINYISFNEANGGFFIYMPADKMAKLIEACGPRFAAAGLSTKFLVGDTYSTDTLVPYATTILQDAAAQPYLGPISFHSWWSDNTPDSTFQAIGALAKQYNKEVWCPEVGYDATLGGTNPAAFATWNNALRLAEIYNRVLKQSGATVALYWEYQTVNNGGAGDENDYPLASQQLQTYPAFYVVKQLGDNLPVGATILDSTSDDGTLMTLAAKDPAKNNYAVQIINTGASANTVTVHGLPGNMNFAVEATSSTQNLVTTGTVSTASGDPTISVPAGSIILLTTLGVTQPPPGPTPFSGTPISVPNTIEAENFDNGGEGVAYHDTTPTNEGGKYRTNDAVDIEQTGDVGGGYDVGWTHAGEWLNYSINVTTPGIYSLSTRVAAAGTGGTFHYELDGQNITGSLTIPNTGSWQTYTPVTKTGLNLTAGNHSLKLVFDTNDQYGFTGNVNNFTLTAATTPTPYLGSPSAIPGTIQIENFDNGGEGISWHDTTPANEGGAYRPTAAPDLETTTDTGGGYDLGYTHAGEWVGYTTYVNSSGNYDLAMRVANYGAGGAFHVEVDGNNVTGTLAVPNTNGFQNWVTLTKSAIPLTVGQHFVKLVMDGNSPYGFSGNYNWMQFTPTQVTPPPTSTPFGGVPWTVNSQIEAENYDVGGEGIAYHDTTAANEGGAFRPTESVDTQTTTDTGGGYNVGWTHAGEWMNYTITVPAAGTYTFNARVAAAGGTGGTFHVEFNGVDKTGQITIPNTGNWQTFTTVSKSVTLSAGTYVMRIVMDTNGPYGFGGNFNWFQLNTTGGLLSPPEPSKNLLFFGNSFTLNNNVPSLVAAVATADGHATPRTFLQASPGWTLTDQLNKIATDGASNVITSSLPSGQAWDDVVIQEYSTRATSVTAAPINGDPTGFRADAATLYQKVRALSPNARDILEETWARGYANPFYPGSYANPSAMQSDILTQYTAAATAADTTYANAPATVAKAGETWRALNWSPDLYDAADQYHPSGKGSLLAALILYRTIYNEKVSDIPEAKIDATLANLGVSASDWTTIAAVADSIT